MKTTLKKVQLELLQEVRSQLQLQIPKSLAQRIDLESEIELIEVYLNRKLVRLIQQRVLYRIEQYVEQKLKWKLEQKLSKYFNVWNLTQIWTKINQVLEDLMRASYQQLRQELEDEFGIKQDNLKLFELDSESICKYFLHRIVVRQIQQMVNDLPQKFLIEQ